MIRVYRVLPGESFGRARERAADFETHDVNELQRKIHAGHEPWTRAELDALRQATANLENEAVADVLVSCGGGIFRCERSQKESPAVTSRAPAKAPFIPWTASERQGLVVVADEDKQAATRTRHLLRFIGYTAESVSPSPTGSKLAEEILPRRPHLVIVGEQSWSRAGSELVRACRGADPIGIAAMIRRDGTNGSMPAGLDVTLELPLRVESIASVLDPILARVREARAHTA